MRSDADRVMRAEVIVVPRQRYTVKQQIRLLLNLLKNESAEDLRNRVWFL